MGGLLSHCTPLLDLFRVQFSNQVVLGTWFVVLCGPFIMDVILLRVAALDRTRPTLHIDRHSAVLEAAGEHKRCWIRACKRPQRLAALERYTPRAGAVDAPGLVQQA